MDKRVLESLATCALYPYLEGRESGSGSHDGLNDPNGAEFADSVAVTLLGVPQHGETFFSTGFNFALALAGAITEDPAHSPDLKAAIAEAKRMLGEAAREAA
jgi:hypothetical protein